MVKESLQATKISTYCTGQKHDIRVTKASGVHLLFHLCLHQEVVLGNSYCHRYSIYSWIDTLGAGRY